MFRTRARHHGQGADLVEFVIVDYGLRIATEALVRDNLLEPIAPLDLLGQVARADLDRLARRLDGALEHCDDLELGACQLSGRHRVEGRLVVDLVHHEHGPNEEQIIARTVYLCVQLMMIEGDELALLR